MNRDITCGADVDREFFFFYGNRVLNNGYFYRRAVFEIF